MLQGTRGLSTTTPHPYGVTVVVHPYMPTGARQEWQGREIVHWVTAFYAALGVIFWGRVKIHPLDDAALEGEGFGFGSW